MNWDIFGAMGEWAGALVVVATLFYLAKQIGLSNRLALADADKAFLESWTGALTSMASDTTTASIMQRGFQDYLSLSQPEKFFFHLRMTGAMNAVEVGVRLAAQGLVSQDILESTLDAVTGCILATGGSQWWQEAGPSFSVQKVIDDHRQRTDRPHLKVDELSMFQTEQTGAG